MKGLLESYKYTRQYVFLENTTSKFQLSLDSETESVQVDDYLWKVVSSISQRIIDGKIMHMIQYEDKKLGWIELKDSIQIFRHSAEQYKVVEESFSSNKLNSQMGIEKDFISHFKDKLLTVKSEISFEGQRYFSVFIKSKFHGFHHENVLDPLLTCEVNLSSYKSEFVLYKLSNLIKPINDIDIEEMYLVSIFKKNKIGKVLVNNENYFWIDLSEAETDILEKIDQISETDKKSDGKLELDDLLYSVNQERGKTKDILKSVLSAKKYLKSESSGGIILEENNDNLEYDNQINKIKKKHAEIILEYERKFRRVSNELKLERKRLEQQRDYNNRVSAQRDKYKERMNLLEDKVKNLNHKYKSLKNKYKTLQHKKSSITKIKTAFKGDDK